MVTARKLLASISAGLLLAAPTIADVWHVDLDATGAKDGGSWNDAYPDLQDALAAAQSGDEIWVAEGTYFPTSNGDQLVSFLLPDAVGVYGGFVGDEIERAQRDFINNVSRLSGDIGTPDFRSDNSGRVVDISGTSADTVLDGFVVERGGSIEFPNYGAYGFGSGIYSREGSATLRNLVVRECEGLFATGLYVWRGPGLIAENVSFVDNKTFFDDDRYVDGGTVHVSGASVHLQAVSFLHNGPGDAQSRGGALVAAWDAQLTLENCLFAGNETGSSGGQIEIQNGGQITLSNCTMTYLSDSGSPAVLIDDGSVEFLNSIVWPDPTDASSLGVQVLIDEGGPCTMSHTLARGSGGSGTGWILPNTVDLGGNLDAAPLFAIPTQEDFQLLPLSPAINAGENSVVASSTDLLGNPRIHGSAVDMGAYEYQGAVSVELRSMSDLKRLFRRH